MSDLARAFGALVRHHMATPTAPEPPTQTGVAWVWAANGVFKQGVGEHLEALIQVAHTPPVPGLVPLAPTVRWRTHAGRVPGELLASALEHARRVADRRGGAIEQQYLMTYRPDRLRPFQLELPRQQATATQVRYDLGVVCGRPLVDLHSHHRMRAFFSDTDDRDDNGLSVSAVLGRIFAGRPEICVRINVWGHRQRVPATLVFTHLPDGIRDIYPRERTYEDDHHP